MLLLNLECYSIAEQTVVDAHEVKDNVRFLCIVGEPGLTDGTRCEAPILVATTKKMLFYKHQHLDTSPIGNMNGSSLSMDFKGYNTQ